MKLVTFKILSTLFFLVVGLIGGFLPLKITRVSQLAVHVAYAFSGGILASVAMVHMLGDSSGDLEAASESFAQALGGKDSFPLAEALFLIGFLFICFIEALLHHKLRDRTCDHSGRNHVIDLREQLEDGTAERGANNASGLATLVGLSIHSVLEGAAAGAVRDETQEFFVVLAIACHKGFAAFANASVNLSLVRDGRKTSWTALVLWFAFSGPVGMIIGFAVSADLEGTFTAAITALAAGSLLFVGVCDLLLPALQNPTCFGWKLLAATCSTLAMTLLAVWA